jgi:hypothetical protein
MTCCPAGPLALQQRGLLRQERLGLGAGGELPLAQCDLDGVDAGCVDCRQAPGPAQHLHQRGAVGDRHPAGAVHHVAARAAEHVRDALAVAVYVQPGRAGGRSTLVGVSVPRPKRFGLK